MFRYALYTTNDSVNRNSRTAFNPQRHGVAPEKYVDKSHHKHAAAGGVAWTGVRGYCRDVFVDSIYSIETLYGRVLTIHGDTTCTERHHAAVRLRPLPHQTRFRPVMITGGVRRPRRRFCRAADDICFRAILP
ncbi:hypothetical protein EVAR_64537_1 [Eumeta japonica]|uniref:Uncharacterized protein n=1 Tax=Eumeta variegata TaxID=151549 RepID=A0A4C1ZR21_EUMVA|nr:hypothetical protein EVAR_64537_1 [Eumeta japonica]